MNAISANNQNADNPLETDDNMLGYKDLYESQQRGVDHLYESNATQFVAPMGFGKTAVAMTAIGELIIDEVIDCALVIAPKRVAQLVWPNEQKLWKHLQFLRVKPIIGLPWKRQQDLLHGAAMSHADIFVVGVDNVPWLVSVLRTTPRDHPIFQCLVIDELSRFKNPRGVWSKEMRKIAGLFRIKWGLTGTPRPNGIIDQFAPLSIISANTLWSRSFDKWRNENFYATDYQRYHWAVQPGRIAQLEADISKFTVTVDVSDMPDLPELVVRDHFVELPRTVMKQYKEMETDLILDPVFDEILDTGNFQGPIVVAANMGVATIKMAQIVQGFVYSEEDETGRVANYLHGAKEALLEELVEDLSGDPVLIVYEFQEDLERMKAKWPDLRWLGEGTTDAQAAENEQLWNMGLVPIMALHPASAGHGLNLQHGGHQMIFYGMTWSAELYDQTIKRFHRQGQKEHCFVHRILARDTIDEAKVIRVENKISAQEAFKRYLRRV